MKKRVDGTFRLFEVKRTGADVIQFVIYLAVGGFGHACTLGQLYKQFQKKQRYKDLEYDDFLILMEQVDGYKDYPWTVSTRMDHGIVEVK